VGDPGFLSLLVWQGLLNDDFGVVNQSILGHLGWHPGWLFGGNVVHWIPFITWPRIAVIFVSVWLTTPYFFLVSMGALQSIPEELTRRRGWTAAGRTRSSAASRCRCCSSRSRR
jgi:arabinogalactan oligomer/maltooligosaccharide transport system permease protein